MFVRCRHIARAALRLMLQMLSFAAAFCRHHRHAIRLEVTPPPPSNILPPSHAVITTLAATRQYAVALVIAPPIRARPPSPPVVMGCKCAVLAATPPLVAVRYGHALLAPRCLRHALRLRYTGRPPRVTFSVEMLLILSPLLVLRPVITPRPPRSH